MNNILPTHRGRIACAWVLTGNARSPLACVWMEVEPSHASSTAFTDRDGAHAGYHVLDLASVLRGWK